MAARKSRQKKTDPRPKCRHCRRRFIPATGKQVFCGEECRREAHQYGGLTRFKIEQLARKVMRDMLDKFESKLYREIERRLVEVEIVSKRAQKAMRYLAKDKHLPIGYLDPKSTDLQETP